MSDEAYESDNPTSQVVESERDFLAETNLLGDLKLQPYSPTRVVAAQAMQLHYGFVDLAGVEQFDQTGLYPGMVRDVAIVLWLCATDDRFQIDQAGRDPVKAAEKALEWAAKQGILDPGDGNSKFWEARTIFLGLMDAISRSRTVPKKKATPKPTKKNRRRTLN